MNSRRGEKKRERKREKEITSPSSSVCLANDMSSVLDSPVLCVAITFYR